MSIEAKINSLLDEIEEKEDVTILYACESGSRCWEMESENSDYDVRFIYVRPRDYYLRVDLEFQRDVIELPIVDDLDVNGWDLKKALRLMYKSNPPLIEWLTSPIVYREYFIPPFRKDLLAISENFFSPERVLKHYLHMAENNYRQYLQREEVELKKYFYVLRPLLACCFVERTGKMAPVSLPKLIESEMSDSRIKEECLRLLSEKKAGQELGITKPIQILDDYLHHKINHFKKSVKSYSVTPDFTELNTFFKFILSVEPGK